MTVKGPTLIFCFPPQRLIALGGAIFFSACATRQSPETHQFVQAQSATPVALCEQLQGSQQLTITLMFGLSRPDGSLVTQTEWQDFLTTTLTPAFPAGLSVQEVSGQWQDRATQRVTHEPARLVWIIAPNSATLPATLTAIRNAYKARFQQQSVGLTLNAVCASF